MESKDYAFSDENLPEDWPELDWQEFLVGEWIPGKTPSSRAIRRQLTEVTRLFRAELAKTEPAFHQSGLQHIREMHRRHVADLIAVEKKVAEIRRRMLPAWELWCARPEGGIQ